MDRPNSLCYCLFATFYHSLFPFLFLCLPKSIPHSFSTLPKTFPFPFPFPISLPITFSISSQTLKPKKLLKPSLKIRPPLELRPPATILYIFWQGMLHINWALKMFDISCDKSDFEAQFKLLVFLLFKSSKEIRICLWICIKVRWICLERLYCQLDQSVNYMYLSIQPRLAWPAKVTKQKWWIGESFIYLLIYKKKKSEGITKMGEENAEKKHKRKGEGVWLVLRFGV